MLELRLGLPMHMIGFRFFGFVFCIKNSQALFFVVTIEAGFTSISNSVARTAFMAAVCSLLALIHLGDLIRMPIHIVLSKC